LSSEPSTDPASDLPPIVRAAWSAETLPCRPFYRTIAPAYASLFVWAPFFDQLWAADVPRAGLAWLFTSALGASLLIFGVLYLGPALIGFQSGQRLCAAAAGTFGTQGAEWLTGIGVALAYIVWYAVAINFAVDSTLLGLHSCGLVDATQLLSWPAGLFGPRWLVFLGTALFWIYITGTASVLGLTGVVAALLRVYAPIAALLLTTVALWFLPHLLLCQQQHPLPSAAAAFPARGGVPYSAVQLICGFFALAGLLGTDWGATAGRKRALVLGGLTGIFAASVWAACMSLIVVAGAACMLERFSPPSRPSLPNNLGILFRAVSTPGLHIDPIALEIAPYSFRWAIVQGIRGIPGGAVLILFGLAALAPACYCSEAFSSRLSAHWPGRRKAGWTFIGGLTAFVVLATGWVSQLGVVFTISGDLFAPVIGAMLGQAARHRWAWDGMRRGVNRAGVWAWAVGCATSVALSAVQVADPARAAHAWPSSLVGLVVAALSYVLLAAAGLESPPSPLPKREQAAAGH
jgi:hypothetical protein